MLTAVEFGLFTKLAGRQVTGAELGAELGLHPRGIADFFDSLVAVASDAAVMAWVWLIDPAVRLTVPEPTLTPELKVLPVPSNVVSAPTETAFASL